MTSHAINIIIPISGLPLDLEIVNRSLLIRWNLSIKGLDISFMLCPLYDKQVENSDHVFFLCEEVYVI